MYDKEINRLLDTARYYYAIGDFNDYFYYLEAYNHASDLYRTYKNTTTIEEEERAEGVLDVYLTRFKDDKSGCCLPCEEDGNGPIGSLDKLPAPTNLTVSWSCDNPVELNWDTVPNANSYRIWRKVDNGPFRKLATVQINSYSDNVFGNRRYYYRVVAVNKFGIEGLASPPVNIYTALKMSLSNPRLVGTDLVFDILDPNTIPGSYRLERSVNGGVFSTLATLSKNTTVYTDADVSKTNTYEYRIFFVTDDPNDSCASDILEYIYYELDVKPIILTGAYTDTNTITLTFDPVSTSYRRIVLEADTGSGFVQVDTIDSPITTYDHIVEDAVNITYRIKLEGYDGDFSVYSDPLLVVPLGGATTITSIEHGFDPVDGDIRPITQPEMVITFTDTGADSYILQRFEDEFLNGGINISNITSPYTETLDFTTDQSDWFYKVIAVYNGIEFDPVVPIDTEILPDPDQITILGQTGNDVTLKLSDSNPTATKSVAVYKRTLPSSDQSFFIKKPYPYGNEISSFDYDVTYELRTRSFLDPYTANSEATSKWSDPVTIAIPSAVTNINTTVGNANDIDITWDIPVSGYNTSIVIEKKTDNEPFKPLAVLASDTVAYKDTFLQTAGSKVIYRVRQVNNTGTYTFRSPWSETTEIEIGLLPPTFTAIETEWQRVTIDFNDTNLNEEGYQFQYALLGDFEFDDFNPIEFVTNGAWVTLPDQTPTYKPVFINSLADGTYLIRGRAFANGIFSEWNDEVVIVGEVKPVLTLDNDLFNVNLNWTFRFSLVNRFEVQRSLDEVTWVDLPHASNNTTFTDPVVVTNQPIYYRVRAIYGTRLGNWSSVENIIVGVVEVTDLVLATPEPNKINVSFNDPNGGLYDYRITATYNGTTVTYDTPNTSFDITGLPDDTLVTVTVSIVIDDVRGPIKSDTITTLP